MNNKARTKRTTTGSMSPELLRKVRIIGAHRGLGNTEVLDKFAMPAMDRELAKIKAEERKRERVGV